MKKVDFEKLKKYETALYTAKHSSFARMSVNEFNDMCNIYKDMYGVEVTRTERNCPSCKLRVTKRLAEDYFKYKDKQLKKQEEKENGKEC